MSDQLQPIWNAAKRELREHLNDAAYHFWFDRTLPLAYDNGVFELGVPNDFARDWIEKRFADKVGDALGQVLSESVAVHIVVDERAATMRVDDDVKPAAVNVPMSTPAPREHSAAKPLPNNGDLNPRYVFERFVEGPHNQYAVAVARSVAEAPAAAYNPVFIYADTGLGKTHLIQAIAHATLAQHPDLEVKYVTVERFTDDFINAVTDKKRIEGFKQDYRQNDVLLIDDVQFLVEKQQTQVEFFHTFNALYEAGKQIVITSDRPPRELEELDERLRTRFGQGVVVDISHPDLETRIAILRQQVKWDGLNIAEPEALEWIAARVTKNVRELYGALTRVISYASFRGSDVTLDLTKEALRDIVPKPYQHVITVEMIQAEVAKQFGFHVNDLRGNRRTQDVAFARQVAMYLSRTLTETSLPQIGERFGGRHHTTVLYAVDKIERQLQDERDVQLHDIIEVVRTRLRSTH